MPRLLYLVNLIEHGSYRCHAWIRFASARELQGFLRRNTAPERDGWGIQILQRPARGYNGKPLHEVHIWLSTPLPPLEPLPCLPSRVPADGAVSDRESHAVYDKGAGGETGEEPRRDFLTWEERYTLQQAAKALLRQLG